VLDVGQLRQARAVAGGLCLPDAVGVDGGAVLALLVLPYQQILDLGATWQIVASSGVWMTSQSTQSAIVSIWLLRRWRSVLRHYWLHWLLVCIFRPRLSCYQFPRFYFDRLFLLTFLALHNSLTQFLVQHYAYFLMRAWLALWFRNDRVAVFLDFQNSILQFVNSSLFPLLVRHGNLRPAFTQRRSLETKLARRAFLEALLLTLADW
jgi:hypothetical protein